MTDWNALFKIGLALFAIVNPIGILPFFIMATNGWSPEERFRTARTVSYTVFTVLVLSALIGDKLLEFFGITIPSFQIGGAQQNKGLLWHFQLIAPIFVIVLLIWLILRLSDGIAQKLGTIGISVITRLMGLILAAMAVEFIAKGLTGLLPKLLTG
jgi:small neutral amino acid transporter SnatA (MarC family)